MIRILSEDGSARLDAKKWIDVKVTLSACYALTTSFVVVLNPVSERAGMRYRKVDMDGPRYVRRKPEDAFVNIQREKENSAITTYLRSTNSLRSNTPPSSGKLVLNTPFRDAGVPASRETRRIYGTSAGGRRMYWVNLSTWQNWTWLEPRTNLSPLAWATIRF
jgi:hypothetical protein